MTSYESVKKFRQSFECVVRWMEKISLASCTSLTCELVHRLCAALFSTICA